MPLTTWRFRDGAEDTRHMGPMAQDFYAAFGLGTGETTISTVDADGVALAAIQGLNSIVEEQQQTIAALQAQNATQQQQLSTQQQDIETLQQQMELLQRQVNAQQAQQHAPTQQSIPVLVLIGLVLGGLVGIVWRTRR
jgi:cobalamin biosynthesis Mg chelatase CobN